MRRRRYGLMWRSTNPQPSSRSRRRLVASFRGGQGTSWKASRLEALGTRSRMPFRHGPDDGSENAIRHRGSRRSPVPLCRLVGPGAAPRCRSGRRVLASRTSPSHVRAPWGCDWPAWHGGMRRALPTHRARGPYLLAVGPRRSTAARGHARPSIGLNRVAVSRSSRFTIRAGVSGRSLIAKTVCQRASR